MNQFLVGIAAVLSTFRITELLICDDGPLSVFARLREFLKKYLFDGVLECYYCASGWVSLAISGYLWHLNAVSTPYVALYWFAVWGGAVLCQRAIRRRF